VNRRTSEALLDLSPPTYSAQEFRETGPNLIQISSHRLIEPTSVGGGMVNGEPIPDLVADLGTVKIDQ
jgi:hypothetical protein